MILRGSHIALALCSLCVLPLAKAQTHSLTHVEYNPLVGSGSAPAGSRISFLLAPRTSGELENVWQVSPRIISGSEPVGEAALGELVRWQVSTVVSVDGQSPNIELAKKFGLRYVHIPIGYGGIPPAACATLTRVARETEGTIYVHCHHGKHRGPAAAALLCRADDGRTGTEALQILLRAGTSKEYAGLWRDVERFSVLPPDAELPVLVERFPVPALASVMAEIARSFERLERSFPAGGARPPLEASELGRIEAIQLGELFAESARGMAPGELRTELEAAAQRAKDIHRILGKSFVVGGVRRQVAELHQACVRCHEHTRDTVLAHQFAPSTHP